MDSHDTCSRDPPSPSAPSRLSRISLSPCETLQSGNVSGFPFLAAVTNNVNVTPCRCSPDRTVTGDDPSLITALARKWDLPQGFHCFRAGF